jgi:hypothetical protein
LIPSIKVSLYRPRRQYITSTFVAIGDEQRASFPKIFMRNFQKVVSQLNKASTSLSDACDESGMVVAELKQQALNMQHFFVHSPLEETHSLDIGDTIFEKSLALEELVRYPNFLLNGGTPVLNAWKMHKAAVSRAFGGRIPEDTNPSPLQTEIHNLMAKGGWTIKDWLDPETNEKTALWDKYEKRYALREIKEVQFKLWKVWCSRRLELDQLHGSSVMGVTPFSVLTNAFSRIEKIWTNDHGREGTCQES